MTDGKQKSDLRIVHILASFIHHINYTIDARPKLHMDKMVPQHYHMYVLT